MYVCICHSVTDRQIREAARNGATRLKHLRDQLGVAATCGKCGACAREVMRETHAAAHRDPPPAFGIGALPAFA